MGERGGVKVVAIRNFTKLNPLIERVLNLKLAASTNLLPSPRPPKPLGEGGWRGGVGGGGWMPQRTQPAIDQRVPRARTLRRDATEAEKKLWRHLRQPPFKEHHFRRQATIGPYFADFASHQVRIVIEVDGGQHSLSARDEACTRYLEACGYRVLRFWNNEVLENMSGVLSAIDTAIYADRAPTPDPSPPQAGGGE
jgi:very-short-patch-repair endonuclease